MRIFQGIAVSPGVASGPLRIVRSDRLRIGARKIWPSQVERELARLDAGFAAAEESLEEKRDAVSLRIGNDYGQIFEAHLLILRDAKMRDKIRTLVRDELIAAESAVDRIFDEYAALLQGLQEHFAERANDILDVKERLLRVLLDANDQTADGAAENASTILLASNLTPSDASNLDPAKTLGVVAEMGGLGSHTAIVASALQIPTVLGVGPFLADAVQANWAIVDGDAGRLILDPTPDVWEKYGKKRRAQEKMKARLASAYAGSTVAKTRDGVEIKINGNIEFPYEADVCLKNGASGIGLYRTEFLFLGETGGTLPDEETHFRAYKKVAETMGRDRPTVIRTFDLGADKLPEGVRFTKTREPNPFMGLRSIRLSLRNSEMFRQQLRAIARAAVYGDFRVMFPLVSTITEFRQAKMIFRDVCEELAEERTPFEPNIPLGIMVETPATVIILEQFLQEVDFFSVGTNDLLQYSMAVDRSNKDVSSLYAQESPALLRFVKHAVEVIHMYGKPVSLCGQMASEPANIPLLLGLGLRSLSVAPGMILRAKEVCGRVSIDECEQIARKAAFMETAMGIRVFLRRELRDRCPDMTLELDE